MPTFRFLGLDFKFEFALFKEFKEISLTKLLKLKKKKQCFVIEPIPSKHLESKHFVHAIQVYKFDIEKLQAQINKSDIVVINADKYDGRIYYRELKKLGFKKVFLLNYKK